MPTAALRPHMSLGVRDLEKSVAFYRALFGIEPTKKRADYAKFEPTFGLNFSLVKTESPRDPDGTSHFGIEVESSDAVEALQRALVGQGLMAREEKQVSCCYALQDKFWVTDPDGNPWEIFVRLADDEEATELRPMAEDAAPCCVPAPEESSCCG